MKIQAALTMLVAVTVLASVHPAAAAGLKVGVVDLQKVIDTSKPGQAMQGQLKAEKDKLEADLKKKGDEIEELRQRLERETMVMSKEAKEEKEREGRIKVNDFRQLQKKYRADLQALELQLMGQLKQQIGGLLEEIGKKDGYTLIISNIAVLYAPDSVDITDTLIKKLNAKAK
jgi:outer membrane protein